MTIYVPTVSNHGVPKYRAIADAIAEDIASGQLSAGSRLPPQRELAYQLDVTVGTVSRAYAEIAQRGLVSGEIGRGTYVRSADHAPAWSKAAKERGNGFISMDRNLPSMGPHAPALAETLTDIAGSNALLPCLEYMDPSGPPAHREAGARWFARVGVQADPSRILVCGGAQHALSLCLFALTRHGDPVLMEELTYLQLLDATLFHARRPVGVRIDAHGMVPEALDAACRDSGARVVFMVPTLHNPTCAVMPEGRRREIVEVARAHDLLLVEDDVYGYLLQERPPAIASLAPERTVYVTSISKSLAAGLRVAWLTAPEEHIVRLTDALRVNNVAQPALTGEVVRRWIEGGTAERLLQAQVSEAAARHAIAGEILGGSEIMSHPASFQILLMLSGGWTSNGFVAAARDRGVAVLPVGMFAVDGLGRWDAVRVSLSQPREREELRRGLMVLRDLLREPPPRRGAII